MKNWDYLVVILLVAILAVQIYSLVRKRENMSSPNQAAQANLQRVAQNNLQQLAQAFERNNQPTWQPNSFGGFSYQYTNPKQIEFNF